VELRSAEREVGVEQRRAEEAVNAASEDLVRAMTDDASTEAASKRLRDAQAAAAKPWPELAEAARRKTLRAQADLERFAAENAAELWSEYEPRAVAAAEHLDALLREAREAIRALDLLEGEAGDLLKLQGRQPSGVIPQRGLERLSTDLKRRLETSTPPPVPRTAQAMTLVEPGGRAA
jgi:acyl-CoA reductase-like NAD-dependent aldehyde dehydrogenase